MVGGWWWWYKSDYSVCPRPFLRPAQDWVWDRDGTGTERGRDRDGMGQGWDRDGTGTVGRDRTGSSTISTVIFLFKIDCKGLFELLESFTETSTFMKPKPLSDIPIELIDMYTHNKRLNFFLN